jgi:hypothetical protein
MRRLRYAAALCNVQASMLHSKAGTPTGVFCVFMDGEVEVHDVTYLTTKVEKLKLLCLAPETWLNDEVVNFFLLLLQVCGLGMWG